MQKQKEQFDDQLERQQREHEKQLQAARMDYENLLNSVTSVAKNWHSGQQVPCADSCLQHFLKSGYRSTVFLSWLV